MPKDLQHGQGAKIKRPGRAALMVAREETFGSAPPPYLSLGFMHQALAYERQCRAFGGLTATTRRALSAALGSNGDRKRRSGQGASSPPVAGTGALLVREWNGRSYRVEVLDEGYRFDGKTWPSLSAIARRITGTNWSGPRFFGLTPKRGGA